MTVALGVARSAKVDVAALLARAGQALYQGKAQGRDEVVAGGDERAV